MKKILGWVIIVLVIILIMAGYTANAVLVDGFEVHIAVLIVVGAFGGATAVALLVVKAIDWVT